MNGGLVQTTEEKKDGFLLTMSQTRIKYHLFLALLLGFFALLLL